MRFTPGKIILVSTVIFLWSGSAFAQQNTDADFSGNDAPQFTENKGQWANNILYKMRLNGGAIFFEKDQLTFTLRKPDTSSHNHHAHDANDTIHKRHAFKVHFEQSNPQV